MDKQEKTEYSFQQESSTFQTGSTKPPKSHRGLILFLLGLVIFLGGIATALGITNLQLFKALVNQQEDASNAVAFADTHDKAAPAGETVEGLGFCGETVSEFWHNYHGLPRGVFIQSVEEGSDAERQGLLPGDVLLCINGTQITSLEELQIQLRSAGETVQLVVYRDDREISLQLSVNKE